MPDSLIKSLIKYFTIKSLCLLIGVSVIYAGETPSVPGTKIYFINIKDGQMLKSPFLVQFGLTGEIGIAPALADWPDTCLLYTSPSPRDRG